MKEFKEGQVDDIIKLKFGGLVTSAARISYVPNRVLGKVFGVSGQRVRQLYMGRFEEIRRKQLPLVQRLRLPDKHAGRQRWGMRFLQFRMIRWITAPGTLRQ